MFWCFIVGAMIDGLAGVVVMSLCMISKENEPNEHNICDGCFGAANNDCSECHRKKVNSNEE